jgi:hypothetical protein
MTSLTYLFEGLVEFGFIDIVKHYYNCYIKILWVAQSIQNSYAWGESKKIHELLNIDICIFLGSSFSYK